MYHIISKTELCHHGILGMKWGKKNGPPYPLGASDHSASEKKAGWKKSLGGGRNESLYGKFKEKRQKKKQQKAHAKEVQRQMNQFQQNERDLLLLNSDYRDRQFELFQKYNKAIKKNKIEKAQKFFDENEILNKKMSDLQVDAIKNRTMAEEYLKLMQKDNDIVYYVKGTTTTYSRNYSQYSKLLSEKHGKTRYAYDPGVKSVSGSKYVVRAATDKNRKKKKYNDPNKKLEKDHTLYKTYYYYY